MTSTRKEKCSGCDRRRADVSLRISDDRLCQDCEDVNRAACEGRVDKPSADGNELRSCDVPDPETGSASIIPDCPKSVIRNELLCYVLNKMDLIVHDALVKLCVDFYDTKVIEEAKRTLFSCAAVIDLGVRHQRRQGPSKDKSNMEDIILVFHKCSSSRGLPEFVASDLSCLPPLDMNNIDFAHLLHEFQGMRAEMAKMRGDIQQCKQASAPQCDSPWSKRDTAVEKPVSLVVNLPLPSETKKSRLQDCDLPVKTRPKPPQLVKKTKNDQCSAAPEAEAHVHNNDDSRHSDPTGKVAEGFTLVSRKRMQKNRPKVVIGTGRTEHSKTVNSISLFFQPPFRNSR